MNAKHARNAKIERMSKQGMNSFQIAEQYGISAARVRAILKARRVSK